MARPRFHKLAAEQQQAILDAALREFAANGFAEASLNRIIETAGISKGSMYYYFDGKDDLYSDVIRQQLERLIAETGPFPVPQAADPDAYWAQLTADYLRVMRALMASPEVAGLLRGWVAGATSSALREAQLQAEQEMLPWLLGTLTAGQQLGAVRTDVPPELLLGVVMGIGQAADVWLITSPPGDDGLEGAVGILIDMMRRALAP